MPKGDRSNDIERQAEIPLNPKDEHWKRIFDKVRRRCFVKSIIIIVVVV